MNKKNNYMFNFNTLPSLLPDYFVKRYKSWRNKEYQNKKKLFESLYKKGQQPNSFLISCCDSRVNILEIFEAQPGEFFVQRNIASLVPKYNSKNKFCSVLAALEYAVCFLEVKNIIVIGHAGCGGVKNYFDNFNKKKAIIDTKYKGLNNWLEIMRPLGKEVSDNLHEYGYESLEKKTVLLSIKNLISYPFVSDSVKKKKLLICGLWHNIKTGELEVYNEERKNFEKV